MKSQQDSDVPESSVQPIRSEAEVVQNSDEGGVNRRLLLRVDCWPGSQPGQFVMLSPGVRQAVERSDPLLPRPMAVYRVHPEPEGAVVEVLYKATGRGTRLLADALKGDRIRLVGPLGRGFRDPNAVPSSVTPVLVGGGTGIASLYDLAVQAATGPRSPAGVHVILGARSADDLMGIEDFSALGVTLHLTTEDGSRGAQGRVTDPLDALLATPCEVSACGPTAMMRRCAEMAQAQGRRCWVSLENNMACGFGVCLGCAAPRSSGGFALVCTHGPVFDAADVDWEGLP